MLDVCAIVVSYFPDHAFADRLRILQKQVSAIVVVSNGGDVPSSFHAIYNERNLGIAAALNIGIAWAAAHGYKWFLLLDQDSICHADIVERLIAAWDTYPEKDKLGLVGSHYGAWNQPVDFSRVWQEAMTVITSGTLLPLSTYEKVGRFRDDFFIDAVDFDYCLRIHKAGLSIIELTQPVMSHSPGNTREHRVLGIPCHSSHHSAWRWYYMTRNNLILAREHIFRYPLWAIRTIASRIVRTLIMLAVESDRLAKLEASFEGFIDAWFLPPPLQSRE